MTIYTDHGNWTRLMGETWGTPIDGLTEEENDTFYTAYGEYVDAILERYGIFMMGYGDFIGPIDAPGLPEPYTDEHEEFVFELSNFDFDWNTL